VEKVPGIGSMMLLVVSVTLTFVYVTCAVCLLWPFGQEKVDGAGGGESVSDWLMFPFFPELNVPSAVTRAADGGLVRGARVGPALVDTDKRGGRIGVRHKVDQLVGPEPGFVEGHDQVRPADAGACPDEVRVIRERRGSSHDESREHHRQREDEQYASAHSRSLPKDFRSLVSVYPAGSRL
jgi:hypothetical protein